MAVKPIVISIVSDARRAQSGIKGIASRFVGLGKTVAKVSGGAVAALAGTALVKGFGRLQGIEQAQAKLRGLGHDASSTTAIMDNALASVKGTSFGLDEAATAAASAAAAGIKAGPQMEKYLKMVGDAAAITGRDFSSMGAIVNKVNANTKLSMGEVNQVQDAGIPILANLADHYKVSTAEMSKMVSAGKVDAETFNEVLQKTVGGAALEMGNTFSGAMGNIQAALGRLGASVLSGVFSKMPGLIGDATSALDTLGPTAEKIGTWLADALGDAFSRIRDAFNSIDRTKVRAAFKKIVAVAKTLIGQIKSDLIPALTDLWKMFQKNVQPIIEKVAKVIGDLAVAIGVSLIPFLSTIIEKIVEWEGVLVPLAGGILAIVAAIKIWHGVILIITAAKKAWAAVQGALNIVMAMNPIALLVLALVGLVAAIVIAWKRSDKFRAVVQGAWAGIKKATRATFNWVKEKIGQVWGFIQNLFLNFTGPGLIIKHWDTIKRTFRNGTNRVVTFVTGIPDKIKNLFTNAKDWLLDAGKNVLTGLLDGLKGKWEDVKGWFGGITDAIPKLKGPPARDRKLLRDAGSLVMGGFLDGLQRSAGEPLDFLTDYGNRVTDAFRATQQSSLGAFDAQLTADSRLRVDLRLTADAVDQVRRGRELQQDLDAFAASGGRRRPL